MRLMRRNPARAGFTLIELLVVIAIIATLVALTTAAVMRVLITQPQKQTFSELLAMSEAADKFKAEVGFYPPSRFVLLQTRDDYNKKSGDPLTALSLAILDKMFPQLGNFNTTWGLGAIPAGGVTLEGDQCLVFFLGGIGGGQGFAKTGTNPAAPKTSVKDRIGPYFNFNQGRLYARGGNLFPSYMDPWSNGAADAQPYVFFSTGMAGANRYSDSHAHNGVKAYLKSPSPKEYYRKDSFQIISAGQDHKFGPGGLLNSSNPPTADGNDDQSNFIDTIMGAQ